MKFPSSWAKLFLVYGVTASLLSCDMGLLNSPYPALDTQKNILYSSFSSRPKHLDPVRSYSSNEYTFLAQIYEPPLQYHYLKRPYRLIPATAKQVPKPRYFDSNNKELPKDAKVKDIAFTVYDVTIKSGILYQPHPALARTPSGEYRYHNLGKEDLEDIHNLSDFTQTGTRELVAADYIYQIKRLAHPANHSPILGIMEEYIVGLSEYAKTLNTAYKKQVKKEGKERFFDLRNLPLEGVTLVDRYTYQIKIKGKYPQLLYWLAMPFFAPMPVEAEQFYHQPGMAKKNISLDWYPIGTGPYQLMENNPNLRMVLDKNPNFHGETYPIVGAAGDMAAGLLTDAGKPLPFIDRVIYNLEKESIPYWSKFLQGYYDTSGISSDSFDQAISFGNQGQVGLSDAMKEKGINLSTAIASSTYYLGFNMLDEVVGGGSESARKLRRAISIAIDYEEYISIFANGRGIAAQSPLPPGIAGFQTGERGINQYVYRWQDGQPKRRAISEAKQLLAEAGYPQGINDKTGKPLVVYFDITASGVDDKARMGWFRKQLDKINVQLVLRNTDYNRFQEKMRKGDAQLFLWGWNADYPDPENFLFLLYGPNAKVGKMGENAANYSNPEFDKRFVMMKNMENSPRRLAIIDEMLEIIRKDAPWVWGYHPKSFGLSHAWVSKSKPNMIANNTLKYKRLDPELRAQKRREWNKPIFFPVYVLLGIVLLMIVPALVLYRRRQYRANTTSHGNIKC